MISISHFHTDFIQILSLSYFNVRENILMQLTQPANNSKNASGHCCDHVLLHVLVNNTISKWSIFQIEINKKHNCWNIYHSWFGTNDNKTSVIERKQNHKLWIINTAFIRGFTCILNFAISCIQGPHDEINNNRVGQSREIYSNSVPLSPPHWPYPKRIRPPSWPRVAVASSIQNTKLFTWRTWPGAGAVPKCDWAARSQCGFKQRRADHTKYI